MIFLKVKDIDRKDLEHYLKLELNNYDEIDRKLEERFLDEILKSAKEAICEHNGLTKKELDESETLNIPLYILCAEMYDRRALITDKNNSNKVLDILLSLSDKNLL